jgi:hypothetical protein
MDALDARAGRNPQPWRGTRPFCPQAGAVTAAAMRWDSYCLLAPRGTVSNSSPKSAQPPTALEASSASASVPPPGRNSAIATVLHCLGHVLHHLPRKLSAGSASTTVRGLPSQCRSVFVAICSQRGGSAVTPDLAAGVRAMVDIIMQLAGST